MPTDSSIRSYGQARGEPMPENRLSKVLAAAVSAAGWHARQRRKGRAGQPYINHLLEVATLVSRATQGRDADLVIAALLHDAVEGQGHQPADHRRDVRGGCRWAGVGSDRRQITATGRAQAIAGRPGRREVAAGEDPETGRQDQQRFGDRTRPATGLPIDRQLDYVQWGRDVVAGLRGASPELEERFDEAADEATRLI